VRTVPGRTDRVVVIGAGLGGLAAALHLAGAGREVTILERMDVPGGHAGVLRDQGYTFDTGPTVLTAPWLVAETLAAVGEEMHLDLRRLDPAYRARFADGSTLDIHADVDAMAREVAAFCGPGEADGYRRLVGWLRELYDVEMPHFIARNLDSPLALLGRPLLRLIALGGFRRLAPKISSFVRDERLQRLFTFQSMYAGLAPAQALALYGVIAYLDSVAGVYFPIGGVHAVPQALATAAIRHGVTIRYSTAAERLEIRNGRVAAVVTQCGERIPADVVVDNRPPDRPRTRYSPSCVVLYAGVRSGTADAHHTISFGAAWRATFAEIIRHGRLMSDPSFLLTTPTVTDPALAPPRAHAHYVLFPAPNLAHPAPINWATAAAPYAERMLHVAGLDADVLHLMTPADWAARDYPAGTPFGAAHTIAQTGPFRLPTLDRGVENLLRCGANVQPGIGVPMALVSGRLAATRVTGAVTMAT
jgi:phytoene desaturase